MCLVENWQIPMEVHLVCNLTHILEGIAGQAGRDMIAKRNQVINRLAFCGFMFSLCVCCRQDCHGIQHYFLFPGFYDTAACAIWYGKWLHYGICSAFWGAVHTMQDSNILAAAIVLSLTREGFPRAANLNVFAYSLVPKYTYLGSTLTRVHWQNFCSVSASDHILMQLSELYVSLRWPASLTPWQTAWQIVRPLVCWSYR